MEGKTLVSRICMEAEGLRCSYCERELQFGDNVLYIGDEYFCLNHPKDLGHLHTPKGIGDFSASLTGNKVIVSVPGLAVRTTIGGKAIFAACSGMVVSESRSLYIDFCLFKQEAGDSGTTQKDSRVDVQYRPKEKALSVVSEIDVDELDSAGGKEKTVLSLVAGGRKRRRRGRPAKQRQSDFELLAQPSAEEPEEEEEAEEVRGGGGRGGFELSLRLYRPAAAAASETKETSAAAPSRQNGSPPTAAAAAAATVLGAAAGPPGRSTTDASQLYARLCVAGDVHEFEGMQPTVAPPGAMSASDPLLALRMNLLPSLPSGYGTVKPAQPIPRTVRVELSGPDVTPDESLLMAPAGEEGKDKEQGQGASEGGGAAGGETGVEDASSAEEGEAAPGPTGQAQVAPEAESGYSKPMTTRNTFLRGRRAGGVGRRGRLLRTSSRGDAGRGALPAASAGGEKARESKGSSGGAVVAAAPASSSSPPPPIARKRGRGRPPKRSRSGKAKTEQQQQQQHSGGGRAMCPAAAAAAKRAGLKYLDTGQDPVWNPVYEDCMREGARLNGAMYLSRWMRQNSGGSL